MAATSADGASDVNWHNVAVTSADGASDVALHSATASSAVHVSDCVKVTTHITHEAT